MVEIGIAEYFSMGGALDLIRPFKLSTSLSRFKGGVNSKRFKS
jgi:hypothetical protein